MEPSGNNHNLIKSVLKRRTWFTHHDLVWDRHDQPPVPGLVNLIMTQVRKTKHIKQLRRHQIYNHFDNIGAIATKSALFLNMARHLRELGLKPFEYIPETYLVPLVDDFKHSEPYLEFMANQKEGDIWIYKPGQSSNRGNGIKVFNNVRKLA